ncbi:hypothetical protein OU787_01680 [Kitasatospora sp. YST-16]|nr:hypothetical protein [Kitasatospora sp. YST-16]WAL70312.1 hypothetical protein OU787_01680 [Kitasatospora sp. YST-16]WNW36354.1 hypothetical protein RKE32_01695 [Streptomyces sp. Li-HN-5-13]
MGRAARHIGLTTLVSGQEFSAAGSRHLATGTRLDDGAYIAECIDLNL